MMWKVPYESLRAPKQTGSVLIFFQLSERNLHCFCQNENNSFGKKGFYQELLESSDCNDRLK